MKLNKTVGKGATPTPKDVMIVQKCLSAIKAKTKFGTQPLWKGKVDGKNSPDLIKAIEVFQQCEGLKVTGKIEAIGPTFKKLKQKTPLTTQKLIESDPFMGELPQGHLLKEKEAELKKLIGQLRGFPPMSAGNTLVKYWTTLKELGDPIAQTALDIHFNKSLGIPTLIVLKMHLGDNYLKNNPPKQGELEYLQRPQIPAGGIYAPNQEWRKSQNKWIDLQIRRIQIAVAIEHWNVSAKDNLGVLGKLNREQISTYHHKVFQDYDLPPEAFGGTYFEGGIHSFWNNLLVPLWCKNCEKLEFEK